MVGKTSPTHNERKKNNNNMLMNRRMHEKEHSLVLQSDGAHKATDLKFPTENQMFKHFTNQRRSFINFKTLLRIHCCF